jgi:uncharacterized protein (TIGR00255 family)
MTAYGRATQNTPLGRFVVEIQSVNRKMLDISVNLPKDLLRFDIEVRKWLSQTIERGQLTVRVTLQAEAMSGRLFEHQISQLKSLKEGWDQIAIALGYDAAHRVDLPFLASQLQTAAPLESKEMEETAREALQQAVEAAVEALMKMKEEEGKLLSADIQKRLKLIEEYAAVIEAKREEPLHRYRNKITERLKEMGMLTHDTEERVLREVAMLAEKMDVTEEIVRLKTHIEHFRRHLISRERAVGRTLDFLTQEMHREVNTLGSKSMDSDISMMVVNIKSEIEKIREQVQNIE